MKPERVEIGFDGGQVIAARLTPDQLKEVRQALERAAGWFDLSTEEGDLALDLRQVVFVRIRGGEHRIGFSGPQ